MYYSKVPSQQMLCDVLENLLLESLRLVFCFKTLGPDITLKRTIYLNIVADKIHPPMLKVFPNISTLFQQYMAPCPSAQIVKDWFEKHDKERV